MVSAETRWAAPTVLENGLEEVPMTAPLPGKVYLVGAGPGDPGLITARGIECLQQADLILYDGLVNPWLLHLGRASAVRTSRVEGTDGRHLPQAEINAQLVAAAQSGQTVVRLKGGDPFVFGRGSEEAAALAEAGIEFEVVPGITAATAAAVYAGISLTHRDHASAVALITGHEDPTRPQHRLDYAALAAFPGTLVFYMGLHRLPQICEQLLAHGLAATTPAAVVCRATTPAQQTITATLADLPTAVRTAGLHPPSLVIIGDCVSERGRVGWVERRPLQGLSIAVARAEEQSIEVGDQIWRLGGEPVLLPTIQIRPLDDWTAVDRTLTQLDQFEWLVFSSVNGVNAFFRRLWDLGLDARSLARLKLAAIGPSTAAALIPLGLRCDLVPATFRAEALAEALLAAHPHGPQRVLWARASRGRQELPLRLAAAGWNCAELVVYRNEDVLQWPAAEAARLDRGEIDWLALSSPSIAQHVARLASPDAKSRFGQRTHIACISPVTAAAAQESGLPVDAVAETHTWRGLLDAIAAQHARRD